jgi:hypothetical protein
MRGVVLLVGLTLSGCLTPIDYAGLDDGGVDVGDTPDLSGAFGPDDAGNVAQDDLAGQSGRYHPVGFSDPAMHGPEMKLQKQDCRTCHGAQLTGGASPVSCDSCHTPGWRTNCSFCHGSDATGLPPRDINGVTDATKISFPAHATHAAGNISNPFACTQCHRPNLDALSNLHIFDSTPARAEVLMAGGLSNTSTYDETTKTCANNYCHGNGQTGGTIAFNAAPRTCHDCHADITTSNLWATMSGAHRKHLNMNGVNCTTCHNGTVKTDPLVISDKTRHIDGKRNIAFNTDAAGITYDVNTRRCTGSCHGAGHNFTW